MEWVAPGIIDGARLMRDIETLFLKVFFLSILICSSGCATLPNVSEIIEEIPLEQKPRQISSSSGLLSPGKSKAIMSRLNNSGKSMDILERHTVVMESVTSNQLTKGNKVTLLTDGTATYTAMLKAIQEAKTHINLESYVIEDDETGRIFADLLLHKRALGVQVHLIYDSMGSMNTPESFFQRLRDGGIQIVAFNPLKPSFDKEEWGLTHRDHRKILIADGSLAIIGGINISKVYSSNPFKRKRNKTTPIHWRDTDIQIEGPAVAEFQKLFQATWLQQTGLKLPDHDLFPVLKEQGKALIRVIGSTPGETNRLPFIMYVSAITFAEHSIHLTSSYFIPDKQIIKALTSAVERGVDVKIILPGVTDSQLALHAQRHLYSSLLKAGVKLYEQNSSLLHAKTAVIDKVWSTVGSTNLDSLSMLHNDEVNAVVLNREFAAEMEKMFVRDLTDSRQIEWNEWKNRPWLPRIREWFVSLFARWL